MIKGWIIRSLGARSQGVRFPICHRAQIGAKPASACGARVRRSPNPASTDQTWVVIESNRGVGCGAQWPSSTRYAIRSAKSDGRVAAAYHGPVVFAEDNAMKLPRRRFLHLAAGAAMLPAVS